jgi:hypothetical protein
MFVLFAIFVILPGTAASQKETNVHFIWAFGALVGSETDQQMVAVKTKTQLHSGDNIKFYLQLLNECYVYLFYYSSQGQLDMLFPAPGDDAAEYVRRKIFIPAGDAWFRLDESVGKEKFFLIAATRPLYDLEALYRDHLRLTEPAQIQASARHILDEIKAINRQNSPLTAPAERPVRLGGNMRGVSKAAPKPSPDVADLASEVLAADFFSRTFTIDHR